MEVRLVGDVVWIQEERDPSHWDEGGVIIAPEAHAHATLRGTVLGVGPGLRTVVDCKCVSGGVPLSACAKCGGTGRREALRPTTLKKGDLVCFPALSGQHVSVGGIPGRLLHEFGERGPLCVVEPAA